MVCISDQIEKDPCPLGAYSATRKEAYEKILITLKML
jgi:hypothetical protein